MADRRAVRRLRGASRSGGYFQPEQRFLPGGLREGECSGSGACQEDVAGVCDAAARRFSGRTTDPIEPATFLLWMETRIYHQTAAFGWFLEWPIFRFLRAAFFVALIVGGIQDARL